MKKKMLELYDYDNHITETGINLYDPEIVRITIEVISGDEIAHVEYSNGAVSTFDSSDCRDFDFKDGEYILLDRKNGIDRIDEFLHREDSYTLY